MKRFQKLSLSLLALTLLVACGNDNKSGKNNNGDLWGISQYGVPQMIGSYPTSSNGMSVASVIQETPCLNSYGYGEQRIPVQIQLSSFPSQIPSGSVYVGVTSYGDVATIVGTGGVPVFMAYLCPRSAITGQGSLSGVSLGSYTRCRFQPIVGASMYFADGTVAKFRQMDAGRGTLGQNGQIYLTPYSTALCN